MINRSRLEIGSVLVFAAIYYVLAGFFAVEQSIWVDETTQLAGLTLSFKEQWNWLLGRSDVVLGVPPDRMPPMSYWIGNVWGAVFGVTEGSMRWLGIIAVSLAAPALYMSGRLIGGVIGGFLCLGLVLLSGTTITTASAIRAYPIYLLLMCWATLFYCLLIVRGDSLPRYVGFASCLVAASYTHFFGVIAAVCIGAALLVDRRWRGAALWPVLILAVVGAVSLAGLAPFVLAAIDVSSGNASGDQGFRATVLDAARLLFRVIAHPNLMGVSGLLETHLGLVLVLAFSAGVACLGKRLDNVFIALVLPIVIGFILLICASVAVSGFEVFAPHYNLWMMPLVAVALSYSLRTDANRGAAPMRRWISGLAGALLVATTLGGSVFMVRHATLYSNGPGDWMASRLTEWQDTLVIHAAEGPWGSLYFALFYHGDGTLEQWLRYEEGAMARIGPSGFEPVPDPAMAAGAYKVMLSAHSFSLGSREIARLARGDDSCDDVADALVGPSDAAYCAYLGVGLRRLPKGP